MGLTQRKVSALLRGELSNISERKLMDCLNRLGYDIEIRLHATRAPVGRRSGAGRAPYAHPRLNASTAAPGKNPRSGPTGTA
jgi:hypothetical protein